jgi:DNA-binding MarR family transcriptional regulator
MLLKEIMSNTFSSAAEHTAAVDAMRDFYQTSQRTLNRLMSSKGVSLAKTKMMLFIHRHGKVRSADLVEAFGFAPRTITEAVDGLEKDGLVERVADTVDRRVKYISLTPEGVTALQQSEPLRERFITQLFEVLSNEEKAQLAHLLGRLNGRLRELEEETVVDDAGA